MTPTHTEICAVVIECQPEYAAGFRRVKANGRLSQKPAACRAREGMVETLVRRCPGITNPQISEATGLHLEIVRCTLRRIEARNRLAMIGEFEVAAVGYTGA